MIQIDLNNDEYIITKFHDNDELSQTIHKTLNEAFCALRNSFGLTTKEVGIKDNTIAWDIIVADLSNDCIK